jgi:Flp pilus assembly protein TadG
MTPRRSDDRGAVSTFLAVIFLALLMAAGLVVDGGRKIVALREASHLADNAARAGAQAIDIDTLRATGHLTIDPGAASVRALDYLAATGHQGDVSVSGDTVAVTVTVTVDPALLPVGQMTVTATETAAPVTEDPR